MYYHLAMKNNREATLGKDKIRYFERFKTFRKRQKRAFKSKVMCNEIQSKL